MTALQSGQVVREVLRTSPPTNLRAAGVVREVLLIKHPAVRSAGVVREVLRTSLPTKLRAAGVVREVLRTTAAVTYDPGTLAVTLPAPTLIAAGKVLVAGTLSKTLPAPTLAAAGQVFVAGALSRTLPAPTLASAGKVAVSGGLSKTLPAPTLIAFGGPGISGGLSVALPPLTINAHGYLPPPTGPFVPTTAQASAATGSTTDIVNRIKAVLPTGWFPTTTPGSPSNSPILDGVLTGLASAWSWLYSLLAYVKLQTRISTATDVNLDIIALDYFGTSLQRLVNETDTAFRGRIKANLLAPKATRAAVSLAVQQLTGVVPFIFEPRKTTDTGGYGHLGGENATGLAYGMAGGYGSLKLPFQAFIIAQRPSGGGIANVGGYYSIAIGGPSPGGYGVGAIEYATPSMIEGQVTDAQIYATIAAAAPVASIMWTAITDKIPDPA